MVPPPKFKGHAREKQRPITRAHVAEKMEAMPKMIADFRRARREKLEKRVKELEGAEQQTQQRRILPGDCINTLAVLGVDSKSFETVTAESSGEM